MLIPCLEEYRGAEGGKSLSKQEQSAFGLPGSWTFRLRQGWELALLLGIWALTKLIPPVAGCTDIRCLLGLLSAIVPGANSYSQAP